MSEVATTSIEEAIRVGRGRLRERMYNVAELILLDAQKQAPHPLGGRPGGMLARVLLFNKQRNLGHNTLTSLGLIHHWKHLGSSWAARPRSAPGCRAQHSQHFSQAPAFVPRMACAWSDPCRARLLKATA